MTSCPSSRRPRCGRCCAAIRTAAEQARVWWDIAWIWGPPEDHLAHLIATVGVERFVFGTGQPLRIPENAVAKLDLLDLSQRDRAAIESGNVTQGVLG